MTNSEFFLGLRELLSKNPYAVQFDVATLCELLFAEHYISRRVARHEVETALEALRLEGGVLP